MLELVPFYGTKKFRDLIFVKRLNLFFHNTGKNTCIGRVYADMPIGYCLLKSLVQYTVGVFYCLG